MKRVNAISILVGAILLIAFLGRIWGMGYDLPYIYHPDEPVNVTISQRIFKTGDLNPHFFQYPSVFFYINSFAYIPYYFFGKLLGVFTARNDILLPVSLAMGVTKSAMPATILLGRAITVIFGVVSVWLVFIIGKRLTGKPLAGALALLMMAVSPTNVRHSRFITPDTFVVFFAASSFLAIVLVYQQGKTWHYIMAGVCIGLTASTKYNGGLIVLPLLFAHFMRHGKAVLKKRNIYLAILLCVLGFIAATPFALIDFPKFLADLRVISRRYSTGHAGMEGDTLRWYLSYMWDTAGVIYIFAALEIIRGLYSRSKEIILLSVFPVVYFVFIAGFMVRNDRTFLPLTPFLFLLAASSMVHFLGKARELQPPAWGKISTLVIVCLVIGGLIVPASEAITDTIRLTTINSRETARVWISENLPPGAKIAIESYSPFVDPATFSVHGFGKMIDRELEWYFENSFEYLILSEGMYGRFYRDPERYRTAVSKYEAFFNRFALLKIFRDGNYEVRVCKVE